MRVLDHLPLSPFAIRVVLSPFFVNPSIELNCCPWRRKSAKLNDLGHAGRHAATTRHPSKYAVSTKFINHARVHLPLVDKHPRHCWFECLINNVRCMLSARSRLPGSRGIGFNIATGTFLPFRPPIFIVEHARSIVCRSCSPFIWASFFAWKQWDVMFN